MRKVIQCSLFVEPAGSKVAPLIKHSNVIAAKYINIHNTLDKDYSTNLFALKFRGIFLVFRDVWIWCLWMRMMGWERLLGGEGS